MTTELPARQDQMKQRHLRKPMPFWPLMLVAIVAATLFTGLTVWWQSRPQPLPGMFPAPAFEMTTQNGTTISNKDLQGKFWIANFIFTNCAGPCPRMTEAMASITEAINSPRVRFISFTVDPKRDLPPVLKMYGNKFGADHARWLFLTEPGTSYLSIAAGFKVAAIPADGSTPILHSEFMFLVDGSGNVRGIYSHADEVSMKQLVADTGRLLNE